MRGRNKGVTSEQGVTKVSGVESVTGGEGVTDRIAFIQKALGPRLTEAIEHLAGLFADRAVRYERAYRYHCWWKGQVQSHVLPGDMIPVLKKIAAAVNPKLLKEVQLGVERPVQISVYAS